MCKTRRARERMIRVRRIKIYSWRSFVGILAERKTACLCNAYATFIIPASIVFFFFSIPRTFAENVFFFFFRRRDIPMLFYIVWLTRVISTFFICAHTIAIDDHLLWSYRPQRVKIMFSGWIRKVKNTAPRGKKDVSRYRTNDELEICRFWWYVFIDAFK